MQNPNSFRRRLWWLAVLEYPDALPRKCWVELRYLPGKRQGKQYRNYAQIKLCEDTAHQVDGQGCQSLLPFCFMLVFYEGVSIVLAPWTFPWSCWSLWDTNWEKPGIDGTSPSCVLLVNQPSCSCCFFVPPRLLPTPFAYSQACSVLHVFRRESRHIILGCWFLQDLRNLGPRLCEAWYCNAAVFVHL